MDKGFVGINKYLLGELLAKAPGVSYSELVRSGKVIENFVSPDDVKDLLVAINQYELFIGWIEIQSKNGLSKEGMSRYLVLKQIHSRIKMPGGTQLERARAYAVEYLMEQKKCPSYTPAVRKEKGCRGACIKQCDTCGHYNPELDHER